MNAHSKNAHSKLRGAFSLIELILVLAILILIAALSAPMLQRTFDSQKVDRGADRVRSEMGKARVRAMRSGDVFAFFYAPGGARFKVAAFNNAVEELMRSNVGQEELRSSHFDFVDDLLPRGVKFAAGDVLVDRRAEQTRSEINFPEGTLRPILFYPDGTAQDAKIILQNDKNDLVEVQLRGLTGIATVQQIEETSNIR